MLTQVDGFFWFNNFRFISFFLYFHRFSLTSGYYSMFRLSFILRLCCVRCHTFDIFFHWIFSSFFFCVCVFFFSFFALWLASLSYAITLFACFVNRQTLIQTLTRRNSQGQRHNWTERDKIDENVRMWSNQYVYNYFDNDHKSWCLLNPNLIAHWYGSIKRCNHFALKLVVVVSSWNVNNITNDQKNSIKARFFYRITTISMIFERLKLCMRQEH